MKKLTFIAAILLSATSSVAYAATGKPVPCPAVVGNKLDRSFLMKKNLVCFSNVASAKAEGYVAEQPPQSPITFQGQTNQNTMMFYIKPGRKVRYDYKGTSNFIVELRTEHGKFEGLLVNTIGSIIGETRIYESGRFYLEVTGNGIWTITIE